MRRVRIYKEHDKWRVALTDWGVIKFLSRNHYCDLSIACQVKRVAREWHRGIVRNTNFSPYLPLEPSLFSVRASTPGNTGNFIASMQANIDGEISI
jgi:hypothetical protein